MAIRRPESVVVWQAVGFDNFGEVIITGEPKEYENVRWEDAIVTALGYNAVTAEVFINDNTIKIGSAVWRGRMRNLPENPIPLFHIVAMESVYDLKGRYTNTVYVVSKLGTEVSILKA